MKICFLTETYEWGGKEVHTAGLAKTLSVRGHEVSIVEFCHKSANIWMNSGNEPTFNIISIDTKNPVKKMGFIESYKYFRTIQADLCIFPKAWFPDSNWRFDLAARIVFKRYVVIEHSTCESMPKRISRGHLCGLLSGIGLWWYVLLLKRYIHSVAPNRVFCVSEASKNRLLQSGYPERKLKFVHNGINPDRFNLLPDFRTTMRTRWGFSSDAMVFGSVGRMCPVKGFDNALDLFHKLVNEFPLNDVRLVLVGNGPECDLLRKMVANLGLNNQVMITDFTERPWEVYPAFDIFIMPSRSEGLPLTLLEAMACGCCPIAMGVGGIPEVISHSGLGWLIPPSDHPGFLAAMKEAVSTSKEKLREMGEKCRYNIVLNFNASIQFGRLADLLEDELTST